MQLPNIFIPKNVIASFLKISKIHGESRFYQKSEKEFNKLTFSNIDFVKYEI